MRTNIDNGGFHVKIEHAVSNLTEKLIELIDQTFKRECSLYLACNEKHAFFISEQQKKLKLPLCPLRSPIVICLIWFFMPHQQSFS